MGLTLAFFKSLHSFSMLKGAFLELDPAIDCGGSCTTFKYVIPAGLKLAMVTGAALTMGTQEGPTTMVKPGAGVGSTGTSSMRGQHLVVNFLHKVEYQYWDKNTTHNMGSLGLSCLLSFTTLPNPLLAQLTLRSFCYAVGVWNIGEHSQRVVCNCGKRSDS